MTKRLDIMVDLETLGRDPSNPVIQIGAVAFNLDTGEIYDSFVGYGKLTPLSGEVNEETYKWWLKTDAMLLQQILAKGVEEDTTEDALFKNLVQWITLVAKQNKIAPSEIMLWGNGMLFDNYIIRGKCEKHGVGYPILYYNDRDVRTIVDLYCAKSGMTRKELTDGFKNASGLVLHDAVNDCMIQIKMVKHCWDSLVKGK